MAFFIFLVLLILVVIVMYANSKIKESKTIEQEMEAKKEEHKKWQQEFEERQKARMAEVASRPSYDSLLIRGHGEIFTLRNLKKKDSTGITRMEILEPLAAYTTVNLEESEGGRIIVLEPVGLFEIGELGQKDSETILEKSGYLDDVYAYFLGLEFDNNDRPIARIEVFFKE